MFQIHLDDHVRHRLGVAANQCDFFVRASAGVFTFDGAEEHALGLLPPLLPRLSQIKPCPPAKHQRH